MKNWTNPENNSFGEVLEHLRVVADEERVRHVGKLKISIFQKDLQHQPPKPLPEHAVQSP